MDLKQLEYFTTIVNEGTISAAAKKLNLSQPPLSAQMKALEQEFGCVLFERGSRSIQLTEAGHILYRHAVNLLELSNRASREMYDFTHGIEGTLRIGVTSSVVNLLLDKWLAPFHLAYPKIDFEIVEANTYELLDKLQAHLLEVALVRTPFPEHGFCCMPLLNEPMIAVGAPSFFESPNAYALTLMELVDKPIIIYKRWEKLIETQLLDAQLTWHILCKNDDARTSIYWANNGLGIAIVPFSALPLAQKDVTTYKIINHPKFNSSISVIHNQNTYISTISNLFIDYIKKNS